MKKGIFRYKAMSQNLNIPLSDIIISSRWTPHYGVKLPVLLKNFNEQEFVRMFENIPLYLHIDLF